MISASIICCARDGGDSHRVIQSLRKNCGLEGLHEARTDYGEYEVLEEVGCASMAEGYNRAVAKAQGQVLVFTHTDVRVWAGQERWESLLQCAMAPETGFVGVAGTRKLQYPGVWWDDIQVHGSGAVTHQVGQQQHTSAFGPYGQVVVLDGVFLAISKEHFKALRLEFPYDTGFHFYDIITTLDAHLRGAKNKTFPLSIFHGSVGVPEETWVRSRGKFLESYHKLLPVEVEL